MSNKKNTTERELLISVYEIEPEVVAKMTDDEVSEKVKEFQKSEIKKAKNPNKFWIINGLPEPKEHEIKTDKKWGIWIVISLFILFAGFFGMFFWMAFGR